VVREIPWRGETAGSAGRAFSFERDLVDLVGIELEPNGTVEQV